jgi:hypothetical protein
MVTNRSSTTSTRVLFNIQAPKVEIVLHFVIKWLTNKSLEHAAQFGPVPTTTESILEWYRLQSNLRHMQR